MSMVLVPSPARERGAVASPSHAPRRGAAPQPQRPARRPAAPTRRGHLRVVQPGERARRRLTPFGGLVLTAFLFLVMAGMAGAHTLIAQGRIRLDELDGQLRTEQARYQQLRKDVAGLESPERIVAAAQAQGMVTPEDLVYLQPDTAAADIAAPLDAADDGSVADHTTGSWSTIKPMLEAPAP